MRTHSKFATIIRSTNANKLTDLLERTGMTKRMVKSTSKLEEVLLNEIDYSKFEDFRMIEVEKSKNYIAKCLKV